MDLWYRKRLLYQLSHNHFPYQDSLFTSRLPLMDFFISDVILGLVGAFASPALPATTATGPVPCTPTAETAARCVTARTMRSVTPPMASAPVPRDF